LAFLLLTPFIKSKIKTLEKPVVVFGIDNSKSIILSSDSTYYKNNFTDELKRTISSLSSEYNTDTYLFGDKIIPGLTPDFSGNYSDYTSFFNYLKTNYKGLNVGAVVIAGDGIFNRGTNPLYTIEQAPWPIYTIALGDTTTYSDLRISNIRYNDIVYLNDKFPLEINIAADKLKGKKAELKVSVFGKTMVSKKFLINSDNYIKDFKINVPAESKGKHRIKITLTVFKNELNTQNNNKSIFVNILDTHKKILIIANSPHPDLGAVKQSLEYYRNYQVNIKYKASLEHLKQDYDLIILHQIPSSGSSSLRFLDEIKKSKAPLLFILGKQSSTELFNKYFTGLKIKSVHGYEVAQAVINPVFSLFTFDSKDAAIVESFPPLTVPFGNYEVSSNSKVFIYQKLNNIETDFPLILFYNDGSTKNAVITGEGLWLWRMHNYLETQNFDTFETLIGKTVQYLLSREDKRHFKVYSKENYYPGDKIVFNARLYNETWESVNTPQVEFILTNERGEKFNYSFSPYENFYILNIQNLSSGVYNFEAKVKLGSKTFFDKGEFVVKSITIESRKLKANHNLLYKISSSTGGKMIYPEQMNNIPELLKHNETMKTKVIYYYKTEGLNNIIYIMLLILFLLTLEWFLRKYFGSY
jgi:hypothetical protein